MSEKIVNKILFKETQYFASRWLFPAMAVFILVTNLLVMLLFRTINYESGSLDIIFFVTSPFFVLIFHFIRLDTEIDEQGIKIYYVPFVKRTFLFSEITNVYIRKYRPIVEYGGWGLKGWKKSNRAYNIKGDIGLQLELLNSDKVLIGTQRPEELAEVINKIKLS